MVWPIFEVRSSSDVIMTFKCFIQSCMLMMSMTWPSSVQKVYPAAVNSTTK